MSSADHDLRNVKYSSLPTDPQSPSREAEVTFTDEDASWAWRPRTSEEGNTSYDTSLDAVELNIEAPSPGRIGDTGVLSRPRPRPHNSSKPLAARESRARKSTWTCIHSTGVKSIIHSDKRGIIQKLKLGVPIRDMRLLDPNLLTSETGKILVRDNVIVVSIEHVRVIITADCVIIPREGFEHNPLSMRFNSLLEDVVGEYAEDAKNRRAAELRIQEREEQDDSGDLDKDDASSDHHVVAPLPFELQVLEAMLKDISGLADQLTKDLEAVAHPALDALTKSVSTSNLERVRKVKTRHQRLYTRVTTIREELQRFLEDDEDMMKMCLTRKKDLEQISGSRTQLATNELHSYSNAVNRRHSLSLPMASPRNTTPLQTQGSPPWHSNFDRDDSGALQHGQDIGDESESHEAVENLLESYFMQIDSAYDRLEAIGEYIEDTEEYINIELDSSRNRLLRLEIVLTAGTFGIAMFGLVAGILGENLIIPPAITKDIYGFVLVNVVTLIVCLLIFGAVMAYIRIRRLM